MIRKVRFIEKFVKCLEFEGENEDDIKRQIEDYCECPDWAEIEHTPDDYDFYYEEVE